MKLVSIDTETTGLNIENSHILEIGLVVAEVQEKFQLTEKNQLRIVFCSPVIAGNPMALTMNNNLINEMAEVLDQHLNDGQTYCIGLDNTVYVNYITNLVHEVEEYLRRIIPSFLEDNGIVEGDKINVVGKNFGMFDKDFIEDIPILKECILNRTRHRVLDVGSMYFKADDEVVPNLKECRERAGLPEKETAHTAIEDAVDVIKCIQAKFDIK